MCGSQTFERISVTRSDGSPDVTEFVACIHCRAMYHRPATAPRQVHPQGPEVDDWAAQYRKSVHIG